MTIHGEKYCVLGEFWKEADGDQLLLRTGEETIWYYAHEQDKVKRLCNDLIELLEKKLARITPVDTCMPAVSRKNSRTWDGNVKSSLLS